MRKGDIVRGPAINGNRARFAHHLGAWIALVHLPESPAIQYRASGEKLLNQAMWFALRGMGLTDKAIARYHQPAELARFSDDIQNSYDVRTQAAD